jgi:hypothetical protein
MQELINVLQQQRNHAMDQWAAAASELAKARQRIAELEAEQRKMTDEPAT